jgi:hypothetical protein
MSESGRMWDLHVLYHAGHVEMLLLAQGVRPPGSPRPRPRATAVA